MEFHRGDYAPCFGTGLISALLLRRMTPCEVDRKSLAPHLAPGIGASRKGMTIGANAGDEHML